VILQQRSISHLYWNSRKVRSKKYSTYHASSSYLKLF